jgi:hypothetical protein
MRDHSDTNHVQIDINKTTVQVVVSLDCRRMIAIFLECAVASFPLIVFLPSAAGDQLHAIRDDVWTAVSNEKVNVVARHDVIKYRKTEALFRLEQPAQIRPAIARKFQKKISVVTTMRDMPDVARHEVTIRARHPVSLESAFRDQKRASKRLTGAIYANLHC